MNSRKEKIQKSFKLIWNCHDTFYDGISENRKLMNQCISRNQRNERMLRWKKFVETNHWNEWILKFQISNFQFGLLIK